MANLLIAQQLVQAANKENTSSALLAFAEWNLPVTAGFSSQRASNMDSVSMSLYTYYDQGFLWWPPCPSSAPASMLSIDYYTVLTWWQLGCQWGMRNDLQLDGIIHLWLVWLGLHQSQWIVSSHDHWEFHHLVPMQIPKCRQMPAARAVQEDFETV